MQAPDSLFMPLPVLTVTRSLCVNGCAVPEEALKSVEVLDPYGVTDAGAADNVDASLVALKSRLHWVQALGGDSLCLRKYLRKLPLLNEVLQGIRDKKPTHRRAPRSPDSLVALKIRGEVMLFKNDITCVHIALVGEKGIDSFEWFLQELLRDLEGLLELEQRQQELDTERTTTRQTKGPEDVQPLLDEALKTLREHARCHSAVYCHSSNRMKVRRIIGDTRDTKYFTVKDLKRKRKEAEAQGADEEGLKDLLKRQVDRAACMAISFLDGTDQPKDEADEAEESDDAEPVQGQDAPSPGPAAPAREEPLPGPAGPEELTPAAREEAAREEPLSGPAGPEELARAAQGEAASGGSDSTPF